LSPVNLIVHRSIALFQYGVSKRGFVVAADNTRPSCET